MIPLTDQMRIVGTDENISDRDFRLLFLHVIGEMNIEVPPHLKLVANLLDSDQSKLVESRERKLENDRERQRRHYAKYKSESHAEKRGETQTRERNAPTIPTIPTNQSPTHPTGNKARGVVTSAMVSEKAKECGIPEDFARDFYEDMSHGDWAYSNHQGQTVKVTADNFASTLIGRWKSKRDTYTPPAKPKPPKTFAPDDWQLCRERCANCNGTGCDKGINTPPDKDPGHLHTPEECPHYTKKPQGEPPLVRPAPSANIGATLKRVNVRR